MFLHTLKPQKFIHSSTTLKPTTHPQTAKPHLFAKILKPIALPQTPFVHHNLKAHHTHPNPKTPFVHQNPKSHLCAKLQNPNLASPCPKPSPKDHGINLITSIFNPN